MSILNVRTDDALDAHIAQIVSDLRAQGLPATRSSVVRGILHESFSTTASTQVVRESLRRMTRALQIATTRACEALAEQLPAYVAEAMDDEDAA